MHEDVVEKAPKYLYTHVTIELQTKIYLRMKLSQGDFRDNIALDLKLGLSKWSDVVRILYYFTISAMVSVAG